MPLGLQIGETIEVAPRDDFDQRVAAFKYGCADLAVGIDLARIEHPGIRLLTTNLPDRKDGLSWVLTDPPRDQLDLMRLFFKRRVELATQDV